MKINFTKKQYLSLLRLVYLGNWMINAHKDTTEEKYDDIPLSS